MLTKDKLLAAGKPKIIDVDIPEWGERVRIRALSAGEINALAKAHSADNGDGDRTAAARSIIASVVDDDGTLIFDLDDVAAINGLSASGVIRLNKAINALNGIGNPEDLEKNLPASR